MRIGIDGRKLTKNKTGIGNYLNKMLEELPKLNTDHQYFVFIDQASDHLCSYRNIHYIEVDFLRNLFRNSTLYQPFWLNALLPSFLKEYKIDAFWGPNFVKPLLFPNARSIITIHDLAFRDVKDLHSSAHSIYMNTFLKLILNRKLNILTVSNSSKESILTNYPLLEAEQIDVTYCSYDARVYKNDFSDSIALGVEKKYKLPDEYVLFVGTTTERKNLHNVLQAIHLSRRKNNRPVTLVVAGSQGNSLELLKKQVKEYEIEEYVLFLGYVEEKDLAYLYKLAKAFVFPSFYEGFGIPVLEAMASGTAVITSNVSSLPEVAGKAAYYVDPHSPEEIENAISTVLGNEAIRSYLITEGYKRIEKFKWADSAAVLVKRIEEMDNKNLVGV